MTQWLKRMQAPGFRWTRRGTRSGAGGDHGKEPVFAGIPRLSSNLLFHRDFQNIRKFDS
jgi:hypothetical protein